MNYNNPISFDKITNDKPRHVTVTYLTSIDCIQTKYENVCTTHINLLKVLDLTVVPFGVGVVLGLILKK
jgi:predicted choloylglycine hydrolase